MDNNCRYIKCGVCLKSGLLCNDCNDRPRTIKYTYSFNPFAGTTRISIVNERGHNYMTAEIYGQLSPIAIKSYAIDMCKMLIDKGVIE